MNTSLKQTRTSKWIVGIILTVGGFFMVLPFIWMILSSLKTDAEIMQAIGTGVLTPDFEDEYKMIKDSLFALL